MGTNKDGGWEVLNNDCNKVLPEMTNKRNTNSM
jgi:hypothetical protein